MSLPFLLKYFENGPYRVRADFVHSKIYTPVTIFCNVQGDLFSTLVIILEIIYSYIGLIFPIRAVA